MPALTARPCLPARIIRDGRLSSAQLDSLMLGIQAHGSRLANGARRGLLIGDGAGVGKGRQLAAFVVELARRENIRLAVWVTISNDLAVDAARDLADLGIGNIPVFQMGKVC